MFGILRLHFLRPFRFDKEYKAYEKHNRQGTDACAGTSGALAYEGYEKRAEEGSAFPANVKEPEIFPGFIRRDDLSKIGAGKRLDRSLEHANQYSEHPEIELGVQFNRIQGNTKICGDA